MILCACPTTTVERNWIIPDFTIGGFHRVENEFIFASGKGVNVARVIKKLGGEAACAGLVGGCNGLLFQKLIEKEGIPGYWAQTSADTRLSITVYDPQKKGDATSLCDHGPTIKTEEWLDFSTGLQDLARQAENISISGSIPPGIDSLQLSTLIDDLKQSDKNVWLDLSGVRLIAGVDAGPFAVKINLKEFSELIGQPIRAHSDILTASRQVRLAHGITIVIVTLGPEGAICSSDWGEWIAKPIDYPEVISSIGCGDAFLASLMFKFEQGAPFVECLRTASAVAAASTQQLGPGIFTLNDYQQALARAVVESVSTQPVGCI